MNIKNVFKVGFFTFLSRILGLVRDIFFAKYLGASLLADAFFIAFRIPNLCRRLFAEGAMQSAFIPIFSKYKNKKDILQRFTSEVFTIWTIMIIVLLIILEMNASLLIKIVSPGIIDNQDLFNLAVSFLRISLPYLFFIVLITLYSSILNTYNHFAKVAMIPLFLNVFFILFFLIGDLFENYGYAASYAVFAGGFFQLILIIYLFYRSKIEIIPKFIFIKKLSYPTISFFKRIGPIIVGGGIYQISVVLNLFVASFLEEGSISYLFYADRLFQFPLALIGITIATVVLPSFAENKMQNKKSANKLINWILVFTVPATAGLLIFSYEIISLIFYRGSFIFNDVIITKNILFLYAIALPFAIFSKILLSFLYSHGNVKAPFKITLITIVLNIIIIGPLSFLYGVYGIAFSTSIVMIFNCLALLYASQNFKFFTKENFFNSQIKKIMLVLLIFIVMLLIFKFILIGLEAALSIFYFRMLFLFIVFFSILVLFYLLKIFKLDIYKDIISSLIKVRKA